MKSILTRMVVILTAALVLVSTASAEPLSGKIGSAVGPDWQSNWINLTSATNFRIGDKLKIMVRGTTDNNVIVRLLPDGAHPSSSDGIVGDVMKIPKDGVLQVQIPENRPNVVQISVHGGQKAWDISLGSNNGPITLISVERVNQ